MEQKRHIIVPIDFSESSLAVLDHAVYTAKHIDAEITILHVIETYSTNSNIEVEGQDEAGREEAIKSTVEAKIDSLTKKYAGDNVTFHRNVTTGKIYKMIIETAKECHATGIIMGTNGASGFERIMGTNALRVVRSAECYVTTIRNTDRLYGYKNILVPLDLTKETREKARIAVETAEQFKSKIHILSVQTSTDEFLVNKLHSQLKQITEYVKKAGVAGTAKILEGTNIARTVLDYAPEVDADSIFVMTQQEMGFVDLMIGSAASQIINASDIPVISIRPVKRKDLTLFPTQY